MGDDSPPSMDDMLNCVREIYAVALPYDNYDVTKANRHVTQWFYAGFYKGLYKWGFADTPDQKWLDKANQSGVEKLRNYVEPMYNETLSLPHFFISLNGAYIGDAPATTSTRVLRSDCAGWGGDWITFYQAWQAMQSVYPENEGRLFCQNYLGYHERDKTFDLDDWIMDADAFNIGAQLRNNPSLRLDDAFTAYYKPGGTAHTGTWTRFNDFYQGRFNGKAADICLTMLVDITDWKIAGARFYLIYGYLAVIGVNKQGPNYPEVDDLKNFCAGFDDTMQRLVKTETANLPQ
jgi:hypothetical protein